ncbi:MAG: PEGA domain-containing protein [Byssovorax sp.]
MRPLSPSRIRRGPALLVAATLLGAAIPASAEPSASERKLAKDMLKEAIADEKAGKCVEAIETLKQVVAIAETGEAWLHLGECQAKTGHLLDAIKTWERAEDAARRDKDKPTQQALIPKLAELHERVPTLALGLPPDAKGVTVTIDGQSFPVERTKVPIELDPGEHKVEVKADGRSPFSTTLTLAEKTNTAVSAVLPLLKPEAAEGSSGSGLRVGGFVSASAALVLAGGGVGAFVAAGGAASEGRAACAGKVTCDEGTVKSVRQLDAAALALWVGAGAGAGLAVTLFVLGRSPDKADKSPKSAAIPAPKLRVGPGSLVVEGRF